jgi:hypothetical protein
VLSCAGNRNNKLDRTCAKRLTGREYALRNIYIYIDIDIDIKNIYKSKNMQSITNTK